MMIRPKGNVKNLHSRNTTVLREELRSPGRKANCRIYAELMWRRENRKLYNRSR